jgi:hypothetical protein
MQVRHLSVTRKSHMQALLQTPGVDVNRHSCDSPAQVQSISFQQSQTKALNQNGENDISQLYQELSPLLWAIVQDTHAAPSEAIVADGSNISPS